MFERKIYKEMITWKENQNIKKKALVIKGARQVGKTTIVKEFARKNYENVVYINFMQNESIKSVFNNDLIVDVLIRGITANIPNIKIVPYKTVLIFDEIQECSNARSSIKPFMEDGRFDIIATGSLLGIKGYNKKKGKGVPTGFERTLYMKPMDFEEYLWAKGIRKDIIEYLKKCYTNVEKIDDSINTKFFDYFNEYICVGGMPEVVDLFLKTSDINLVRDTQRDIIEEYKDDFGKHLNDEEIEYVDSIELNKILEVFESIPNQLSKENKKFQYSKIKVKGRASEYEKAIEWLKDAGIISKCYNLSLIESPFDGNKVDNQFKIYMQDTGLFISMLDDDTSANILAGNLGIYKGAIYENIIAEAFTKNDKKLYYYSKSSGLEIDFVTKINGEITLVEVKATNGNAKSLKYLLEHYEFYKVNRAVKLAKTNIGYANNILTIPYYLAFILV